MNENKNTRSKWLHLRLTEKEYAQLQKQYSQTLERKLSTYARKVFLREPVIGKYRNASLDDLVTEFIQLNKTLNGIANNYNQSIHKLHTLDHYPQIKKWLDEQAGTSETLQKSIEGLRSIVGKILEKW